MSEKKVSHWKRKQVKAVAKRAERQIFRNKERKGTGANWGTQFRNTFNRKDKRETEKDTKN
jgi:hypothetical protein